MSIGLAPKRIGQIVYGVGKLADRINAKLLLNGDCLVVVQTPLTINPAAVPGAVRAAA